MEGLREYVLSVTTAAVICGVVTGLFSKTGGSQGLIKLLCGGFLALVVIRPVVDLRLPNPGDISFPQFQEASRAAEDGAVLARESYRTVIKQQTEAYILDKADSLGLEVTVDVTVGGDEMPVPVGVRIQGRVSPYGKSQLQRILTGELGIAKENQEWIA